MKLNNLKFQLAMANSCISMGDLAQKSGVNEVTIRRMLNAVIIPRPKTIGKLAKALGVSVEDIIVGG